MRRYRLVILSLLVTISLLALLGGVICFLGNQHTLRIARMPVDNGPGQQGIRVRRYCQYNEQTKQIATLCGDGAYIVDYIRNPDLYDSRAVIVQLQMVGNDTVTRLRDITVQIPANMRVRFDALSYSDDGKFLAASGMAADVNGPKHRGIVWIWKVDTCELVAQNIMPADNYLFCELDTDIIHLVYDRQYVSLGVPDGKPLRNISLARQLDADCLGMISQSSGVKLFCGWTGVIVRHDLTQDSNVTGGWRPLDNQLMQTIRAKVYDGQRLYFYKVNDNMAYVTVPSFAYLTLDTKESEELFASEECHVPLDANYALRWHMTPVLMFDKSMCWLESADGDFAESDNNLTIPAGADGALAIYYGAVYHVWREEDNPTSASMKRCFAGGIDKYKRLTVGIREHFSLM